MKIVFATPLYPPDIAEPAPYVKELAKRLSSSHEVTIVTYGRMPEKISGVSIVAIDKRKALLVRLFLFTLALLRASRRADVLYAQNGPSVELPLSIVALFTKARIVMHIGDKAAHHYASSHPLRHIIERVAFAHAGTLIEHSPLSRPEILPFDPYPAEAFSAYEASWSAHLNTLRKSFNHAS